MSPPIEMSEPPAEGVLSLARRHDLSVHDAAYLELAARTGAPIATLDLKLRRAAAAAGAGVFVE